MDPFAKPFDGAITRHFEVEAPDDIRAALQAGGKGDMLNPDYPYNKKMNSKKYGKKFRALQIELVKMQSWARKTGARIVIVFEGRDAAGKGGTIKRFTENLNPRGARVVALSKPSEVESSQWYFQRYIQHMPSAGEIVFFDRSWYNRGVVEHVFGFCEQGPREQFFLQAPEFEKMLVNDGIQLFKIWLTVGRAEQLRRFLARESDPLKHWKLSSIDVQGLSKWDAYTAAISETFNHTHRDIAPWIVIRSDDKKRARLAAMRSVLGQIDYDGRKLDAPDAKICGTPQDFGLV